MPINQNPIQHVSDTALWVAYYRGLESQSKNPLFQDPFAKILVGDRGKIIAESMGATARYTQWSVVIRTHIIDRYIQDLVQKGVDTVVNLGAGLDTRPYRMRFAQPVRWIEIDYPQMIEYKESLLKNEKPGVALQRIPLDLADPEKRKTAFAQIAGNTQKALILTEGVIPYLTEEQVTSLAHDLRAQKPFAFWIAEYFSTEVYRYFKAPERMRQMKNAPFQFFPEDWFQFFGESGWKSEEIRYLAVEADQLRRPMPIPWWAKIFQPFLSKATREHYKRQMGYVLFV